MPDRRPAMRALSSAGRRDGRHVVALVLLALALVWPPSSASAQGLRFIRDAEIEDLLNLYAQPIFQAAGLGRQRIRIRIVNDRTFNAFVLDGRNVFINTGALIQAETPNQIIGVIAHETGHIAGGHMAGLREKVAKDSTRALLMQILGIGAMIAGATSGDQDTKDALGGAGQGVFLGSSDVITRSILAYRRVQEFSADQAGVAYLDATHQSAEGMLKTFETFAEQEMFSDPRFKDPYVRSHPMARDRIDHLRELAHKSPYFDKKDDPMLQLRHDLMRAKLSGYLERPAIVFNRYPSSDQSLPARYARAIATFFSKGINEAMPLIDELIRAEPNYAYFHELKGDFLMRKGDAKAAIAPLKKAMALADTGLIRIELATAIIRAGDKTQIKAAIELLRRSLAEEEDAQGYRMLANAYYSQGEEGQAYLATAYASLLEGKLKDAKAFAKRAQPFFKSGSPQWLRADDILTLEAPS
ncbi:MAG: M48 family metalloprotease [Hyphomicrobiaceae bacterium]